MRNTLKIVSSGLVILLAISSSACATQLLSHTSECLPNSDNSLPEHGHSELCLAGRKYILSYSAPKRTISLFLPEGKTLVLEKIAPGFEPELVGAESNIRFLPIRLQPYINQSKVLYLSSQRSSGGDGMGQCGSGAETYLNVLSIEQQAAKIIARIHVGSCLESIEMAGSDSADTDPASAISVKSGKISIDFLSYDNHSGNAILSQDFSKLIFSNDR